MGPTVCVGLFWGGRNSSVQFMLHSAAPTLTASVSCAMYAAGRAQLMAIITIIVFVVTNCCGVPISLRLCTLPPQSFMLHTHTTTEMVVHDWNCCLADRCLHCAMLCCTVHFHADRPHCP